MQRRSVWVLACGLAALVPVGAARADLVPPDLAGPGPVTPDAALPGLAMPSGPAETLVLLHQALVAAAPGQVFTLDRREVRIAVTTPGGTTLSIYPDNLDLTLRAEVDGARRAVILSDHVVATLEAIAGTIAAEAVPATADPSRLLPVLRPADGLPEGLLAQIPHADFPGGLVHYWVQDLPQTIVSVDHALLAQLGLEQEALVALALDNLRARLPEVQVEAAGPYRVLSLDGTSESALMLLPDLWQENAGDGDLVAAVPARDMLFYTLNPDAARLADMRGLAQAMHAEAPYPVSPDLFRWTAQGWVVLD